MFAATKYFKIILFPIILVSLFQVRVFSQGTDIRSAKQKKFYIGLNISPAQTNNIFNSSDTTISDAKSVKKTSFSGTVEIGYRFSKYIGIKTGVGISNYVTGLSLSRYNNKYDTIDSDGDNYKRLISGSDVIENQRIMFINIPLLLDFQLPLNDQLSIFVQGGAVFLFPVNGKFNSTGTFSYSGYYPVYDVTISDVPWENFLSNQKADVDSKLKVKSFIPEFTASAGLNYTIQNKIQLSFGAFYSKFLADISGYTTGSKLRLSSNPDQMRSLLEGSNKSSLKSIGLSVSLRYFLK